MDSGQAALVFFFGLFWASALSAITEFRAFDTAGWWRRRESSRSRGLSRFLTGIAIADAVPLALLWILYNSPLVDQAAQRPFRPVVVAAVASLSVFFVPRFMHAILATTWHSCFYDDAEWRQVVVDAKAQESDTFAAHFVPGVGYVIVFVGAAAVLRWVL